MTAQPITAMPVYAVFNFVHLLLRQRCHDLALAVAELLRQGTNGKKNWFSM